MDRNSFELSDKRAAFRYPVVLFVEFENGTGWTRDISSTGACIETEQTFLCGDAVQFSMLKQQHEDSVNRLQCKGIVVRAEQYGENWRVAVAMEAISFNG